MHRVRWILPCAGVVLFGLLACQKIEKVPERLQGVWKLESLTISEGTTTVTDSRPQWMIYSGSHYAWFTMNEDRQQLPNPADLSQVSNDDLLAAYGSFNATTGTYRVVDNTITHQILMAKIPNSVGTEVTSDLEIQDKGRMIQTNITSDGKIWREVWVKVE